MNDVEVGQLINMVIAYYPNLKMNDVDETIDAWTYVLQDHDLQTIVENLKEYVKGGNVFPPVLANLLKVPEKKKYTPSLEDTRLMLIEKYPSEVATEEERKEGLMKSREILLKSGAKR